MKNFIFFLAAAFATTSCSSLLPPEQDGNLVIRFDESSVMVSRSGTVMPDTDDFLLTVSGEDGKEYYSGLFGDSPEHLSLPPGAYTVSAVSREFREPEYDSPQYGDVQVVVVTGGETVTAELVCRQLNCGLKLSFSKTFTSCFPNSAIILESAEGSLMTGCEDKGTAYFLPGKVSVSMNCSGREEMLFCRVLEARQVLSVNIGVSPDLSLHNGISIQVDTSCNHSSEEYVYGGRGSTAADAFSVQEALEYGAAQGVWVWGYVAGAFSSSSRIETEPPFTKNTNLVISRRKSASDKSGCIAVELKTGRLRDELNLAAHPENLGRAVCLRGDIVPSYYGITGLKNVSAYEWR